MTDTATRVYSVYAEKDADARDLVDRIANQNLNVAEYRQAMIALGKALASFLPQKISSPLEDIYVVCTVEDADFLARGIIERLEQSGLGSRVKLMCLWNERVREGDISISPIFKQYKEGQTTQTASFVVVKSIISGACVVKTNLTRAISAVEVNQIFVVAPVILKGAQARLAKEFPKAISDKFEFFWVAEDSRKNGENVEPGIGGSVYERLGFGDESRKNEYIPEIVKQRRRA